MSNLDAIARALASRHLTADLNIFVSPAGNDNNNGFADTPNGALKTLQKAVDTAYTYNLNGHNLIINVDDGAYSGVTFSGAFVNESGQGSVSLIGDVSTPGNCTITAASGNGINIVQGAGPVFVNGLKISAPAGNGIYLENQGNCHVDGKIEFGTCGVAHAASTQRSLLVFNTVSSYVISGNAAAHWYSDVSASIVCQGRVITLSGSRAFATAFAWADFTATIIANGTSFAGAATGPRYLSETNAVIFTGTGSATFFPGSIAGSTDLGGQYF